MADVKPQVFNPDHVMMHEHKEGELLNDFNQPILLDILQNSKIMQLGKYEDMGGKSEKEFTYWADKPGAYWVGEGQKIRTTKPSLVSAKMRSHKLGVIVVASREFLNYTYSQFFEAMKPQIAEQFYKKFDEAGLLNVDNPFAQSLEQSVKTSGNTVNGEINLDNVLKLEDKLLEHDVEANAFLSKTQNRTALRGVRDENTNESYYDRSSNTLDGLPVVDLKSDEIKKGDLYAGDFNKMFYGIPYNMSYKISEDGQLSTVQNKDGSPVNLFEQELIALRVTMDVAFHIADDNAFAKLTAGSGSTGGNTETV
ncbi:phage major capsid protein [Staphylococcus haemolyticus]|jgi:HK97 family phage major capsid protein|uniref:phage major capsid protein n=1 Tax=Staphylococcus TaxID=1279 RepID=UPI000B0DDF96|nr:phage major capsid protein [Staphylococcus haemolyticus]MCG1578807.1 phage major capsid protein [Staphylococcus epidermidis]MBE7295289.1 phage major capsid protein [Staphylococcus haemolyticus]MCH4365365.1 phage major capsid protein [Staphylococcus haemolyticus]MCH4367676.1 phage major capsid protein [Staphylococcus haemolyticus]TJX22684.1 phage major capsid protein [Staphylococcus haemolyticus]